jgi:hypothetical protein
MQYQELSLDQIRHAIQFVRRNAKTALESGAPDLAQCLYDKAMGLQAEMVRRNAVADIRVFEGA